MYRWGGPRTRARPATGRDRATEEESRDGHPPGTQARHRDPRAEIREWFARRAQAVATGVGTIHPIVTARASGAIVEDVDGNRLIDFATGIAVLNVGHTAPEVVAAVQRQAELDTHTCFHVTANEPYIELAERLNALVPGDGPNKTMFANSGAEAVENAVKIARKATGRSAIIAFDHAFHGRTLMGMTLTAKVMPYKQGMGPFAPEIYRLPFAYPYRCPCGGDTPEACAQACLAYALDEMHKHIGEDEHRRRRSWSRSRARAASSCRRPGFVQGIAAFCAANGIVFVADEIQSGMGRAGRWFAIEDEGVVPDLVTTAKSLGGGLPIGAVTGRAEVMDAVHTGGLGGTYGGNPVAAAAALAVLDKIEREDLLAASRRVGEAVMARFETFRERLRHRRRRAGARRDVRDRAGERPGHEGAARRLPDERDRLGLPGARRDRADLRARTGTSCGCSRRSTSRAALLEDGLDVLGEALAAAAS